MRSALKPLHSSLLPCLGLLGIMGFAAILVAQDSARHREFSANVLMRMGREHSGVGARIYVKGDNLYLDYPDLANRRHVFFWFLGNGLVSGRSGFG